MREYEGSTSVKKKEKGARSDTMRSIFEVIRSRRSGNEEQKEGVYVMVLMSTNKTGC